MSAGHLPIMGVTRLADITDHVIMQMTPFNGADWFERQGVIIRLNTTSEYIGVYGTIREGFSRFRVKLWYENFFQDTIRTWLRATVCGGTNVWNLLSAVDNEFPSSTGGKNACYVYDWYPLTGQQTLIHMLVQLRETERNFYVQGFELLFQ